MRILIAFLMLVSTPSWGQSNGVDYGALSHSLQYLDKVWVQQPRQYENMRPQFQYRPIAPQHVPTCVQVPVYSVIDGTLLTFRTQCY